MSGSGVYVYNKKDKAVRLLVAVFSSNVNDDTILADFNVATRLNAKKVAKICQWIGAGDYCHQLSHGFYQPYYGNDYRRSYRSARSNNYRGYNMHRGKRR